MTDDLLVVQGWEIHAHPLFLDQLDALIAAVTEARRRDPESYRKKRAAKLLAAVLRIAFEIIPDNPSRPEFRQGATLGAEHKHWFRAKFLQQYRLFFRYRSTGTRRIIVLAWLNDDETLRAYGKRSDAYAVFRTMLAQGEPPDDWEALLRAAETAGKRFGRSRRAAEHGP